MPTIEAKLDKLKTIISGLDSALTALSGGVDSSLLLRVAAEVLPGRTAAVTVRSILNPPGEIEAAEAAVRLVRVKHIIVEFQPLELAPVQKNLRDRCYHCKTALARVFKAQAESLGLKWVMEGSHQEDLKEHRPGARAVAEAGLRSPLQEAGLNKDEIRTLARRLGLPGWNRAPSACLATRFPYRTDLTPEKLRQVFEAERLLVQYGLEGVRARHHGRILRLESPLAYMPRLLDDRVRAELTENLSRWGFDFITMDLAGYRSGVFDRIDDELTEPEKKMRLLNDFNKP